MEIIPAIDIRERRCVRLFQGDFDRETVYSDDPVAVALRWQSGGAARLHIVDLDGAARGIVSNLDVIVTIISTLDIPVQIGGGIRSMEAIGSLLRSGADRVILGTSAVENPDLIRQACSEFKERIIIGIDAREGWALTHGWLQKSQVTAAGLADKMVQFGARRFIYTDVSRDGTLTSPNFEAIAELLSRVMVPIIASGGISSVKHLNRLAKLGVEGVIIGRALYTGDLILEEALAAGKDIEE